jgi:uracil phosphoribosyltransferase
METIQTLQEFMLHTKNITYVLIVAALVGIAGFWRFLTDRDDE